MNVQLSNLFQLQSQIFQGLGTQLTTLLELSERIDRLATGGRSGQRATLRTAATTPESSLFSRVMAGHRAIGRFFWKSGKPDSRVLLWNLVANNLG
jgi:hypothetical protein